MLPIITLKHPTVANASGHRKEMFSEPLHLRRTIHTGTARLASPNSAFRHHTAVALSLRSVLMSVFGPLLSFRGDALV